MWELGSLSDYVIHVMSSLQLNQTLNGITHYLIDKLICSSVIEIFLPRLAENSSRELAWGALDDVVMGGVSESTFEIDRRGSEIGGPTGVFKGLFLSDPSTSVSIFFIFLMAIPCEQW